MNEYKKKLAAMQAGQVNKDVSAEQSMTNGIPNSALLSVFEGRSKATSQMMGHRVNLAESINAKMQQAFGMDISGLLIYRSEAMKGTGMHGMAQGNQIVLGSDVNLNTTEGQAVLGHEISHIRAQSQGVGMGHGGLYKNAALEHQADVEGMRAARGRPIYESNMVFSDGMKYGLGMKGVEGLSPMSPGLGATAAAPMQANKDDKGESADQIRASQDKKLRAEFFGNNVFEIGGGATAGLPKDKRTREEMNISASAQQINAYRKIAFGTKRYDKIDWDKKNNKIDWDKKNDK